LFKGHLAESASVSPMVFFCLFKFLALFPCWNELSDRTSEKTWASPPRFLQMPLKYRIISVYSFIIRTITRGMRVKKATNSGLLPFLGIKDKDLVYHLVAPDSPMIL